MLSFIWSLWVAWVIGCSGFYIVTIFYDWGQRDAKKSESDRRRDAANWSFGTQQKKSAPKSRLNPKVQDYLEQLAAKHLGGSAPDPTRLNAGLSPKHDDFIESYHDKLTKVIHILGKALHLRPPEFDDETSYEQPAAEPAHENFAKLLREIRDEAMDYVANMEHVENDSPELKTLTKDEETLNQRNASTTTTTSAKQPEYVIYEEALSTAILNKVILDAGLGNSRKSLSPVISVVDSAVQTDNDGELSATGSGKYNVKSWVTTTTDGFSNFSDDDISLGTSSSNWSGAGADGVTAVPVVHQIEEHVEITYETKDEDNETNSSSSNAEEEDEEEEIEDSSSPQPQEGLRKRHTKKSVTQPIPFPEHGVDIIDSVDQLARDEPSSQIVSQVAAWEDNWLFKRKKKPQMFSSMARESVPMLVPNPINSETTGTDLQNGEGEEREESSDIDDDEIVHEYFQLPVSVTTADSAETVPLFENHEAAKASNKLEPATELEITSVPASNTPVVITNTPTPPPLAQLIGPDNEEVVSGKTAKFTVVLPNAQFAPPVWRSVMTKRILTPQSKKIHIKKDHPTYTLIIYDVQESDAGEYQVLLQPTNQQNSMPLPHITRSFHLTVKPAEKKKQAPMFIEYDNSVQVPDVSSATAVHFKMIGHPEPVLNVFKGNDIVKTLERTGDGQWTLLLDGQDKSDSITGEYVAIATNEKGITQAKFTITVMDETPKPSASPIFAHEVEQIPVPSMVTSSEVEAENAQNSLSSSSETEETMKETSQSLVTNHTVELPDDSKLVFGMAEREKQKWANPIKLEFNPYAPENLAKRIRDGRSSQDLLIGGVNSEVSDNEIVEEEFLITKKQVTPEPNIVLEDKPQQLPSDLGGVKLPSVRQLAQQFSPAVRETSPGPIPTEPRKSVTPIRETNRGIQVHSLTARSVSREFREGLKVSKGYMDTPNVIRIPNGKHSNQNNINGKTDSVPTNRNISKERIA